MQGIIFKKIIDTSKKLKIIFVQVEKVPPPHHFSNDPSLKANCSSEILDEDSNFITYLVLI
jgi:hypothetical protein